MDKQMLSMEELEQVTGGNIFTDAWDWVCEKFSSDDKLKTGGTSGSKRHRLY